MVIIGSLETESCHDANFVVTDGTEGWPVTNGTFSNKLGEILPSSENVK